MWVAKEQSDVYLLLLGSDLVVGMIGVFEKQLGWWLLLPTCLAFWTKYTVEYDAMRVGRCYSKCDRYPSINQCMETCLSENFTKPGKCPEENSMSPFEAVCLIACANDSQCTDLGKYLPPIPEKIIIRREKSNMVTLNWKPKDLVPRHDEGVCYLVEERHVLGPRYSESRLTSWGVLHMGRKPFPSIKAGLKTGHWYQFRVAAVNEKGSRGYSVASKPFKTAVIQNAMFLLGRMKEPRNPREPRNLSLSGARVQPLDGKLRILLRWRQPPSDVPIMFYKLFWSQLIVGPTNESVIISHRSISKDKNCFEIKNLEIGWQYFLQVQAVSVYGGRRIMSKKVSQVFNSTDYRDYADTEGHSGRCERHHLGLRVRRLICQCSEEIDARLVWPVDEEAASYNVSWRLESCSVFKNSRNSKITPNLISPIALSEITQKTRFDIKNLEKNCTYTVNVRSILNNNNNNGNDNNNNSEDKKDNNELGGPADDNWPTEVNEERNLSIELTTNVSCNKIRQNRNNNNNNNNNSNDNNNGDFKLTKCKKRKTRLKKIYNK
ncbi:Similar to ANOS1: Anosmin-1 (Homo sapiens), partial [Cotesia congregata]